MEAYKKEYKKELALIEEVATSINEGKIKNLADIDWEAVTNWKPCFVESIVEKITDTAVKGAVIGCILEKYRIYHTLNNWTIDDWNFEDYCTKYQTHIENYALYNIESIKARENQQITELQKDVAALQKDVAELKNSNVPHFNSPQSSEQLTEVFQNLKDGGFFDSNAKLEMWLYVCGVADLNNEFEPLNWVADKQLLGVLVTKLFDNDKRQYWKVAQQVFIVGGDTITKEVADGMKNSVSKIGNDWRNAPPQADQLRKIIAG